MAFNPDEFLSSRRAAKETKAPQQKVSSSFNPDTFLASRKPVKQETSIADEAIAIGDLVLGMPAQMAGLATRLSIAGAESIGESITGKDEVPGGAMEHARESTEKAVEGTWLSHPLKSLFTSEEEAAKMEKTTTEKVLGAVEEQVSKSADYWAKETDNPAVGELVKLYVDTGVMGVSAGLVGKGASGYRQLKEKVGNYKKENQPSITEEPSVQETTDVASEATQKFDPALAKVEEWKSTLQSEKESKIASKPVVEETIQTELPLEEKPTKLAGTSKEGVVTINEDAIKKDFESGFTYIFNPESETGKQKSQVFEALGITKEQFTDLIDTPEKYAAFIRAHEESHVRNKDADSYPRTEDGKPDLFHPKALEIEVRATKDAWDRIRKETPAPDVSKMEPDEAFAAQGKHILRTQGEEAARAFAESTLRARGESPQYALENTQQFISKEIKEHSATLDSASDLIERSANAITAEIRLAEVAARELEKDVPNVSSREKLTRALEEERKSDRIGPKDPLAPVLKQIKDRLKTIGENAKKAGLINELRNNYVPHVLDWSKSKLSKEQKKDLLERIQERIAQAPKDSKIVRDFSQARQYEFLRELEKMLREVGGTDHGVVVHTDIARIMEAYEKSMQVSIIQKSMIDSLKNGKAPDGNPWLMPDGDKAKDLKYVYFEGKGSRPLRNYRVHPDLVDTMNFMFRESDPSMLLRGLGAASHLTKALNVVGSFFHAKSLAEAGLLTDPKLALKELFTAGSGTRAALKLYKEGGNPLVDTLIRDGGLMIEVEDVQRTIVDDTGKFLDGLAEKTTEKLGKRAEDLKIVQRITNPLDRLVLQKMNKLTWDYMHAGQKLNVAIHLFTKMKLKNPEIPDAVLAKEVSSYVNNTFGGLNWLQVANQVQNKFLKAVAKRMAGIQGREWAQIVLFAPDWTVSTLRAFTTALPKELAKPQNWKFREGIKGVYNPKTQGDLARRYVITTAIAWATILNAINIMISDHEIWENKDPTRIDMGDGTSMQAAKHSMEAAHWLQHPDQTLGNKLGFWPKAMFVGTTGIAYPSPNAPKLKDTSAIGRLEAIGMLAAPFQVSSAAQAPEGEGAKRAILSTFGMPLYGRSHEQLSKSQKEGRKASREKRREKRIKELMGEKD